MSEFWSNLISNAGGALTGTFLAFILGSASERIKINKRNKQKINEYKNTIIVQAGIITSLSFGDSYSTPIEEITSVSSTVDAAYLRLRDAGIEFYVATRSSSINYCPDSLNSLNKKFEMLLTGYTVDYQPTMIKNLSEWNNNQNFINSSNGVKKDLIKKLKHTFRL